MSEPSTHVPLNPEATDEMPARRSCGAMAIHQALLKSDPSYRARQGVLEAATQVRLAQPNAAVRAAGPVTIPVVVHVVYHTPAQNISDAQVLSQIAALNRDFRARNTDKKKVSDVWKGLVSDTHIQFALATQDPQGNAVNGITRTKTAKTTFLPDESVKFSLQGGHDAWPAGNYLNLWVCSLDACLRGYAQFPGGHAETDGVVIHHGAFGTKGTAKAPFHLGHTTTHEVGHWLNLRHPWGDAQDDTGPNYRKPVSPEVVCSDASCGDRFMNYMGCVNDESMLMFTPGQVARMLATLENERVFLGQ